MEQIVDELIQKTIEPVKKCLADAKVGVSDIDEIVMVGGMTRMPKVVEVVQKFFGKEPNKSVNPDEVVAVGASVQAGVLGGDVKDVLLLDVTPLTLGIETLGQVSTPLISRNTTIPTSKSQVFSTAADNQTSVEINVLQGERPMALDNKSLGRFILDGIPPAPRGVPQVEVIFDIDASGILNVTAKDKATGKVQSIKITGSTGLNKDEIEKMTKEAELHADEDKAKKSKAENRIQAESLIFTAEKSLKEAGEKVAPEAKKEVEEKITALRGVLDSGSAEDISSKTQELSDSLAKIGSAMYQSQPGDQKQEQAQPETQSDTPNNENSTNNNTNQTKTDKVEEGEVVQ
jgi:molecular chaperone DnaK